MRESTIETKCSKHATKYQLHTIEKIRDHGANVYIIDNLEDFINVMS